MKNLLVTLLLILGVFYLAGEISDRWFVLHLDDIEIVDPVINIVVFCFIVGLVMLLGFLIAVSLVGALCLGLGAAILGVIFIGIHLLWPILFIILIVYLVMSSKKQTA